MNKLIGTGLVIALGWWMLYGDKGHRGKEARGALTSTQEIMLEGREWLAEVETALKTVEKRLPNDEGIKKAVETCLGRGFHVRRINRFEDPAAFREAIPVLQDAEAIPGTIGVLFVTPEDLRIPEVRKLYSGGVAFYVRKFDQMVVPRTRFSNLWAGILFAHECLHVWYAEQPPLHADPDRSQDLEERAIHLLEHGWLEQLGGDDYLQLVNATAQGLKPVLQAWLKGEKLTFDSAYKGRLNVAETYRIFGRPQSADERSMMHAEVHIHAAFTALREILPEGELVEKETQLLKELGDISAQRRMIH